MDLLQDADGHLVFENNTIPTCTGADEVRQRCLQQLKMVFGEWFMDRTAGVPWFTKIFEKTGESPQAILVRTLTNVPGVKKVLNFTFTEDKETRSASVSAQVLSIDDDEILVEETYE